MASSDNRGPNRVLVTGGPGFIGRRVVQRFLDNGWIVRSFSLPGERPAPGWDGRVEMIYGDVAQADDMRAAATGCDCIVHLAALVGVAGDYDRQWRVIAEGTRATAQAAIAAGARLVVTSSIAVYGDKIQHGICREDDGFGAWQGAYGRAKQAQETIASEVCAAAGAPLTLVRPANVYGLGGASAWGDRFLDMIRTTGGLVVGDGDRNDAGLVYVENLADALFLAATDRRAIGQTFNVCDENGVTWGTFTDDMAALIGRVPPPRLPLQPLLDLAHANEDPAALIGPRDAHLPTLEGLNLIGYENLISSAHIRRVIGWSPKRTYADALREMRAELEGLGSSLTD